MIIPTDTFADVPLCTIQFPTELHARICGDLKKRRQSDPPQLELNVAKMAAYYSASEEMVREIIEWYEGELLSTKFILM